MTLSLNLSKKSVKFDSIKSKNFKMAVNVESDGKAKNFPYRILNDLSKKLKSAEEKNSALLEERKSHRCGPKISCEVCNQAVLSESTDEVPTADRLHGEGVANVDALNEEVSQLKKKVAELVYMNNRYHLSISNCTVCTSEDEFSDASLPDEVSIIASTPVTASLGTLEPSISPLPIPFSVSMSSTTPTLMSGFHMKEKQADIKGKSKDKTFIKKMVKTLTKLEAKYLTPEHKRKKRLFIRKPKPCPIVPKELSSIYNALAAPELEEVTVPDPYPRVRWSDIRFKPALPNPEQCAVFSCSQDPGFYLDKVEYHNGSIIPTYTDSDFQRLSRYNGQPFGSLPGYQTNLGVVAVPTIPVGGYVYCPDAKKWVLFAEPRSSPPRYSASTARRTRQGGTTLLRRRKG